MAVNASNPLQITIHPLPWANNTESNSSSDTTPVQGQSTSQFWSSDAPTFKDVLDTINPLQHLPVISTLYQNITGDVPSSGANVIGGTLIGGPIGLLSAIVNEITKAQTGKDMGNNMLAMLSGDSVADASTGMNAGGSPDQYAPSPTNKAAYSAYQHTLSFPI